MWILSNVTGSHSRGWQKGTGGTHGAMQLIAGAGQQQGGQITAQQLASLLAGITPAAQAAAAQPAGAAAAAHLRQQQRHQPVPAKPKGPPPMPAWLSNTLGQLDPKQEPGEGAKGVLFSPEHELLAMELLGQAFNTKVETAQGAGVGAAGGRGLTLRIRLDPGGSSKWLLGEAASLCGVLPAPLLSCVEVLHGMCLDSHLLCMLALKAVATAA